MDSILSSENLSFIYYEEEQEKQTKPISISFASNDRVLIINDIKTAGTISEYLLGNKKSKVNYKNKELNKMYQKEKEDFCFRKVSVIENNINKQISNDHLILPQLIKNIKKTSDLKKNIYLDKVLHYKEKVKDIKKNKAEIIQNICKKEILTIEEGTKEYKKILNENKNKVVIKKLEARNDYIVNKAKLELDLEKKENKKQILKTKLKSSTKQARGEIEAVLKQAGITSTSFLLKAYDKTSTSENKIINLLSAFTGKKEILIISSSLFDQEEMKLINKLLEYKNLLFIYITSDKEVEKEYFNKVIKIQK